MTRWNKRFENLYTSLSRTPSNAASSSGIRPPLRQAESNTQPPQIPLSENKPNLIRRKSHSQIMMDA